MTLTDTQHWTITRLTYWYLQRGRCREAEQLARGLLSIDETDARAWHYYGEARRRSGDDAEAARAFEKAARLFGNRADIWMRLGEALLRVGRRDEARRALVEALDHAGEDELVGRIEAMLGRC